MYRANPKTTKAFFNALGFFFVLLGIIGAFLPVIPTTPFLLVAAACFSKGSERYANWLREHKTFGPIITDWETRRCIRLRYKVFSISMMMIASTFSVIALPNIYGKVATVILVMIGCIVVLRIPTCDDDNCPSD